MKLHIATVCLLGLASIAFTNAIPTSPTFHTTSITVPGYTSPWPRSPLTATTLPAPQTHLTTIVTTPGYTGPWPPTLRTATQTTITIDGQLVPWPPPLAGIAKSAAVAISTSTVDAHVIQCNKTTPYLTSLSANQPTTTNPSIDPSTASNLDQLVSTIPSDSTDDGSSAGKVTLTPHIKYSSSIGVIGCMINTNRVAYWPLKPDCKNMCIKVWLPGKSEKSAISLMHVDQSLKAHDISMEAFKTLEYGPNWKTTHPGQEDALPDVNYKFMPLDQCPELVPEDGKPPLMAKVPNFYFGCPVGSFAHDGAKLWDIDDQTCHKGVMRECELPTGQQIAYSDGEMAGRYGAPSKSAPKLEGIGAVVNLDKDGNNVPS